MHFCPFFAINKQTQKKQVKKAGGLNSTASRFKGVQINYNLHFVWFFGISCPICCQFFLFILQFTVSECKDDNLCCILQLHEISKKFEAKANKRTICHICFIPHWNHWLCISLFKFKKKKWFVRVLLPSRIKSRLFVRAESVSRPIMSGITN